MSAVPGSSKELESSTAQPPSKSPQPGTSHSHSAASADQDDPKPGPSTTAAEFDLEVFDSGSSCSLEDCWSCKDHPSCSTDQTSSKVKNSHSKGLRSKSRSSSTRKHLSSSAASTSESSSSSENESYDGELLVKSGCGMNPDFMESACPSETEEAISDEEDKMEDDDDDDEEDEEDENNGTDHCQCPKSLIALPPLRLSEAVGSHSGNSCWKCAGPSTSTASLVILFKFITY